MSMLNRIAASIVVAAGICFASPVYAQLSLGDDGIGVDIGGISAGIGTGSGGLDANVDIGGAADAGLSVGGSSVASVDADIGGDDGLSGSLGLGGSSSLASASVGVGGDDTLGLTIGGSGGTGGGSNSGGSGGTGATGGAGGNGGGTLSPSGVATALNGLSPAERARIERSCLNILRQPAAFERDLVSLCRLLDQVS